MWFMAMGRRSNSGNVNSQNEPSLVLKARGSLKQHRTVTVVFSVVLCMVLYNLFLALSSFFFTEL